ncbi:MAG: hypothetical protein JSV58_04810 [Candidatus Bathyarchaeota archaeon]|nr:MAG: hypothetical protein JSV58_04810 [Candidatus Bathyarchaeota archaeon]
MSRRRTSPQIILEILETTKQGKRKTRIMGICNLSFTQVNGYLDILNKAGWIKETEGIWQTTEKGLEVCDVCLKCKAIFSQ